MWENSFAKLSQNIEVEREKNNFTIARCDVIKVVGNDAENLAIKVREEEKNF